MAQAALIRNDLDVLGDVGVQDILYLGITGQAGAIREVEARGSEALINIDLKPKGAGVVQVPVSYEANILGNDRALINYGYFKGNILTLAASALAQAPTIAEDQYGIVYDHATTKWDLKPVGVANTYTDGVTQTGAIVRLGGDIDEALTDVKQIGVGDIYIQALHGLGAAGLKVSSVNLGDNRVELFYGATSKVALESGSFTITANVTGAMKYAADYSGLFTLDRSIPDRGWINNHIGGNLVTSLITTPTGVQHGWVIKWDNVAAKYTLEAVVSGGVTTFTGLTDTPGTYAGEALKAVRVNAAETGLEFYTASSGSGHVIENSGTPLTARANLNFKNGLVAADNNPDTDVYVDTAYAFTWTALHIFDAGINLTSGEVIDVVATGGSDVLNIGTANADVINLGWSGTTINITGTLAYQNVVNLQVTDKLITLNKGGGAGSAANAGIELEEGGVITGYWSTTGSRDGWDLKAPSITGVATFSLANLSANRTYILPDAGGTFAVSASGNIALSATGNITFTGDLPFSSLTQIAGLSILGVTGTSTADVAAITGIANQVLRVNGAGTVLEFGSIDLSQTATVGTSDLAFANLAQGSAHSVLGVTGNATADVASIQSGAAYNILRANSTNTGVDFGTIDLSQAGAIGASILGPANGGTGVANNAASTITISGNFSTTFTISGNTSLTLPASGTVATTANVWTLASGGLLSGVNTITSNTVNQLIFTGTWAQAATNDYHINFAGSFTTVNSGVNDTLLGYKFSPAFTKGAGAGVKSSIAVDINPTFTSYMVATDFTYGLRVTTGRVLLGTTTPNTTAANQTALEVQGIAGGTGMILALYNATPARVMTVGENSEIILGSSATRAPKIQPSIDGTGAQSGRGLLITTNFDPGNNEIGLNLKSGDNATNANDNYSALMINSFTYAVTTSGSGDFTGIRVSSTINQTVTSNQAVYGYRYTPTLTAIRGEHYSFIATSGSVSFTQEARSLAWTPLLKTTAGAHTALTTATEFISQDFVGNTWTWVDGTVATQRFNYFRGYTANKTTTAATFTDIYNVYIDDSTAGTGVTFTRNWALGVDGNTILGGSAYLGGLGVAPTAFLHIAAGIAGNAQLRLVPGVAPSSPNDGDIYYVNTNDRLMFRKNATDAEIISASAVTTEVVVSDTTLTITYNGVTYKVLIKA